MSATDYKDLARHIGHKVEVVAYAEVNVAIECEDCNEVLLDFDKEDKADLTYCEECLRNLEDDQFDYRFDRPVCLKCVEKKELDPEKECGTHTWTLWLADKENRCEECGATEPADPDDIAEQQRLLSICNCAELDDDLIEAGNTCYNCYATNKDVSRLEN